jgi:hypothetical protein
MPGLGNITGDLTVWCSRCEQWGQESENNKARFKKLIRTAGWRQIKGLWVCPDCIRGAKGGFTYPFKD